MRAKNGAGEFFVNAPRGRNYLQKFFRTAYLRESGTPSAAASDETRARDIGSTATASERSAHRAETTNRDFRNSVKTDN